MVFVGLLAAWITIGVLAARPEAMPAFDFLGGRAAYLRLEENRQQFRLNRVTRAVYSWQVDVEGLPLAAHEELLDRGFAEQDTPWPDWNGRSYKRVESQDEVLTVRVLERRKALEHPLASGVHYGVEEAWISFEIRRERRSVWRDVLRGPANLLYSWGLLK